MTISVAEGSEKKADTKVKEEEQRVPVTRVKGKGRIGRMLDSLAATYEQNNPNRKLRWVYSPIHKPELSNIIAKRADGFVEVTVDELGTDVPGLKGEETLRVGDVIGMSIPTDIAKEMREELADAAKEQARSVERDFYASQEEIIAGEHKSKPRGRSVIEERDRDYDFEQRTS